MSEQRSTEIRAASEAIFDELVADLVLTCTINAHREIKRGRMVCNICGTLCRSHSSLHSSASGSNTLKPAASIAESSSAGPSRASSPIPGSQSNGSGKSGERTGGFAVGPEKGTGGSTGIGSGSGRLDSSTGNVFFDCLVCGRPTVSSKYAPHLASCLGLNGSTRRGASRMAAAKARLGTNDRSSPSPMLDGTGSQNGDSDVEITPKKAKKLGLNGNGKRGNSPNKPPLAKKARSLSNVSGTSTPALNGTRSALPPSKLSRPPTTSQSLSQIGDSPDTSPEKSIISLPASSTSGTTAGASAGQRTAISAGAAVSAGAGDDSDDDPDDY